MLELLVLKNIVNPKPQQTTTENYKYKRDYKLTPSEVAFILGFMLIYIAFFMWAIVRAVQCSSATPDSRAIHFLFAISMPIPYVVISILVPGFCPKTKKSSLL